MFFRIVIYYIQQLLNWKDSFLGAGLGLLIGWQGAETALGLGGSPSLSDAIILAWAGPNHSDLILRDFLSWFVIHLYVVFLLSRFLQVSLFSQNTIVLPRIGSRRKWYASYLLFFVLLSNLYVLAMILFTAIGSTMRLRQGGTDEQFLSSLLLGLNIASAQTLILWIWVLTSGTLVVLMTTQLLLLLLLKRVIYSFIGVVFLCLLAWFSVDNGFLQMVIPASQSMLIRHALFNIENPNFTFEWSLLYNSVAVIVIASLGMWLIHKSDIFHEAQIAP